MATWTLGEALESALASILNEVGEGDGCNRPDAVKLPKGTGTEAPAKSSQEVVSTRRGKLKTASVTTQPGKAPASLGNAKGRRAHPHELAPLGARQPLVLVVIEGGRPAQGGGEKPGGLRTDPVEVRAREWKVVEGGRHAALR